MMVSTPRSPGAPRAAVALPRPEPAGLRQGAPARADESAGRRRVAFTLIEMLVVIGIIAALAVTSVPAIRSLSQSNTLASGSRQVLDELALARQIALSERRTVYLVLIPPAARFHHQAIYDMPNNGRRPQMLRDFTNRVTGQYTSYALFTRRTVGDQPGKSRPRYLSGGWKTLPDGMFFATNLFIDLGKNWTNAATQALDPTNRPLPFALFPFPAADSPELRLPYIAFDPSGRVYYEQPYRGAAPDVALTISRGSIFYPRHADGQLAMTEAPDVVATPRTNRTDILVNHLTGRARVLEQKIQ